MKPLTETEALANTYEGLAPVPMDLARRVRVEQMRRRIEAGQKARAVQKQMAVARMEPREGGEPT